MRKFQTVLASFALLLGAICSAYPEKPMNPVLQQLDLDGDLVLFMNTDTVEKSVLEWIDLTSDGIVSAMQAADPSGDLSTTMQEGITKLKTGINWSGLLSMESYAVSMKPVDGTLSRIISIAKHTEGDGNKPLWRILTSDPEQLQGIRYVPADAVYTANTTTSLGETWNVLNEAAATFYLPEQLQTFNQQIAMFEMILGTNITALTDSLDNEILLSLQLSEEKTVSIPVDTTSATIPEPSLLIGLKIKNPLLGNLILQKATLAQLPISVSTNGAYQLHSFKYPGALPIPVEPTLVMTSDYLLLGSTPAVIRNALDCYNTGNGLVSTPLYRELLHDAPEKVSAIEFVSPRFIATYIDVMTTSLAAPEAIGFTEMMEAMCGRYRNMYSGGYSLKTPTGIYSRNYADYGGAKPVDMVASAYIGMLSAIAIPSFHKARANAQENRCINNLRIMDCAKEQWALESGKNTGSVVTPADISEYIKGGFSTLKCLQGGTYTIEAIGTSPSCSVHGSLPY